MHRVRDVGGIVFIDQLDLVRCLLDSAGTYSRGLS